MTVVNTCKAAAPADFSYQDAYYSIRATVTTGSAFTGVGGRLDSSAGKVIGRIAEKLFGVKRGRSLSIIWQPTIANQQYPLSALIKFTQDESGAWTIATNQITETQLHRITTNPKIDYSLYFAYSDRAEVDFDKAKSVVSLAIPAVASEGAGPVVAIAKDIAKTIYEANSVKANNTPTRSLIPSQGQGVRDIIEIKDPFAKKPAEAQVLATITVEVRGTRSLFRDVTDFGQLTDTLPRDGAIDAPHIDDLTSKVLSGKPSTWPAVYSVLAGMKENAPFGRALLAQESDVAQFCIAANTAIRDNFPLTPTDQLLLKAAVLELAARPIRKQINPYPACFSLAERAFVQAKLGIDTNYVLDIKPDVVAGIKNLQILRVMTSWFTNRSCAPEDIANSPLADYLPDFINIIRREDLAPNDQIMLMPLTGDHKAARADFLAATCNSFAYWNTPNEKVGSFNVDSTKSSSGWRVSGNLAGSKLSDFSISK